MFGKPGGLYNLLGQAMMANAVGGVPQPLQPALPAGEAKLEPAPEPEPREVELDRIVIGKRIRKAMGDLTELIASILAFGILVPLLVRRMKDNSGRFELVDGARRLQVCRDIGLTAVPVRVIELERLVDGEIDVTVLHEAFTVSERVSIGLMVESDLGERRGRPKKDESDKPNRPSDQVAWKRAGFGNQETYRQAKEVVASGEADLISKMDLEEVSIYAAFNEVKAKEVLAKQGQAETEDGKPEGDDEAPTLESFNSGSGRKRSNGVFPPACAPSETTTAAEEPGSGDAFKVRPFTQAMACIHKCLDEHGAFNLKPEVIDGALCLPAKNPRLALIVAVFKVKNIGDLIREGKLTLKVAK